MAYEYITRDNDASTRLDFHKQILELEQEFLTFPDPWGSALPTYYQRFKLTYNQCAYFEYSAPEALSPGEEDPAAYDVTINLAAGCISNLQLTEE